MRISRWIGLLGIAVVVGIVEQVVLPLHQVAIAQIAEVPRPDRNGDFNSAILGGNVGNYYPNSRWLIMPQADTGVLNCRESPNGPVVSRIVPGAIVQAVFNGPLQSGGRGTPLNTAADAIDLSVGKPWLQIAITRHLFLPPAGGSRSQTQSCYVRANLKYIAPINEEAN